MKGLKKGNRPKAGPGANRRALKAAGWTYGECIAYGFGWFDDCDQYRAKTSAEAVKLLVRPEVKKARSK